MKTTIDIPSALYRRVKIQAAMRGIPIREFLIDCLQHGLEEDAPESQPGSRLQAPVPVAQDSVEPATEVGVRLDEDGWPVVARAAGSDGEKV